MGRVNVRLRIRQDSKEGGCIGLCNVSLYDVFHFLKGLRAGILDLFLIVSWRPCQCCDDAFCWILRGAWSICDTIGSSISDSGSGNVFFLFFLLRREEVLFLVGDLTSTYSLVSSGFLVSRFFFFVVFFTGFFSSSVFPSI